MELDITPLSKINLSCFNSSKEKRPHGTRDEMRQRLGGEHCFNSSKEKRPHGTALFLTDFLTIKSKNTGNAVSPQI